MFTKMRSLRLTMSHQELLGVLDTEVRTPHRPTRGLSVSSSSPIPARLPRDQRRALPCPQLTPSHGQKPVPGTLLASEALRLPASRRRCRSAQGTREPGPAVRVPECGGLGLLPAASPLWSTVITFIPQTLDEIFSW